MNIFFNEWTIRLETEIKGVPSGYRLTKIVTYIVAILTSAYSSENVWLHPRVRSRTKNVNMKYLPPSVVYFN